MTRHFVPPMDADDRGTVEDQAAARDAQFLDMALAAQHLRAEGGAVYRRGRCANCDAPIDPARIYCDADCQADHEHRLGVMARQGKR